ncbi:PREDICTED: golgin subfamily A member 7 [Tinamus guttatus]|uniref:golgin subfamily A member 7 n=1 Tax=Tinamus guttatus TaxID=94827 RepID=UPI00052EC64E|nr:PREDICTED: golgin subfamily A member 7 [Tinamus guttatus]
MRSPERVRRRRSRPGYRLDLQPAIKVCLQAAAERENRIDRQQFEETVRTLNNLYAEAEKLGGQSYLEGCLACLTAYTIFLCMETHYEKVLKKIAKFIQEQNEKIYAPQGLLLTDPIERGLRVIEITIYEDRGMSSGR